MYLFNRSSKPAILSEIIKTISASQGTVLVQEQTKNQFYPFYSQIKVHLALVMKQITKSVLVFIAVLPFMVFASCSKKSTVPASINSATSYPDSFYVDGGPVRNFWYSLNTITSTACNYDPSQNMTSIQIIGKSGDSLIIRMILKFTGNSAGKFNDNNNTSPNNMEIDMINFKGSGLAQNYICNHGTDFSISNYGSVGGLVNGSFEGSFFNSNYSFNFIFWGSFSVLRNS